MSDDINLPNHILVIEDDPAVAQSLQAGLERHGYQVVWKNTGAQGVEYARQFHPSLVLLDVRLPDGSGFDFCRRLRQMGLRQPIIMLTVQSDEVDKVLGLELGADDYLTKPYNFRELLSRIHAQLRRAYGSYSNAQADLIFVQDLVIDPVNGQVQRANQVLNLTPTEFKLLVYLARHRNQALTRAQIVEAIWAYAPDADSEKSVNVHIRRLREKVERDPSRPAVILTVPGIGYRLVG